METLVQFFYEEVDFSLGNEDAIIGWILQSIKAEGAEAGVINIIFCNDDYLLDLNQRFLNRGTLTDVIAFEYSEEDGGISGDIFISIERVRENAKRFGYGLQQEIRRVIIHGILHLCGYQDNTPEDKARMTAKEDNYLSLLAH